MIGYLAKRSIVFGAPGRELYIGGLPLGTRAAAIHALVQTKCQVSMRKTHCFVLMETPEAACEAIQRLNLTSLDGCLLRVRFATPRAELTSKN